MVLSLARGGIQAAPDAVGFDRIIIRPQIVNGLEWVQCSYNSVRGRVVSNWKRKGSRVEVDFEIPANTTALVYLPFGNLDFVKANGKPIQSGKEYRIVEKLTRGTVVLSFASGRYKLEVGR